MSFEKAIGIIALVLLLFLFICGVIYRCGFKQYLQARKARQDLESGPSSTPSIVIASRLAPMNQTRDYEGSMPRLRNNTYLARGLSILKDRLDLVYTLCYVKSLSFHMPSNLVCPSHNMSNISLRWITPRPFVTPGLDTASPGPGPGADVVRVAAPVESDNHGFSSTPVTGSRDASMDITNAWRSPSMGPTTPRPYSPLGSTLSGSTAIPDTSEASFVGQESNRVSRDSQISPVTSVLSFATARDTLGETPYLSPIAPARESPRVSFVSQEQGSPHLAARSRRNDVMRIATLPKQPPLDMGRWTDIESEA